MQPLTKGLPLVPKVHRIDIGVLGANTITWADNTSPDAKATSPAVPTVVKIIPIRSRHERRWGDEEEWGGGVEHHAEGMREHEGEGAGSAMGTGLGDVDDAQSSQVANRVTKTDTTYQRGEEIDTARLRSPSLGSGTNGSDHNDAEIRTEQVDVSRKSNSHPARDMDMDMATMINFAANTGICMQFVEPGAVEHESIEPERVEPESMQLDSMDPEHADAESMDPQPTNNKRIGRLTMLMTELLESDWFTAADDIWIDSPNPAIDDERMDEEDDELVTAPSSQVLPINISARGPKGTALPEKLTTDESRAGESEADAFISSTLENVDGNKPSRPTSVNLKTYKRDSILAVPRKIESMNIGFQGAHAQAERVAWPGYGNLAEGMEERDAQDCIRGRMSWQTNIDSQNYPASMEILPKNIDAPMATEDISTDILDAAAARISRRGGAIPHPPSSTMPKMEPAVGMDVVSTSGEKRSSCVDIDVGKQPLEGLGISVPDLPDLPVPPPSKKRKTV
jgi:hypothetical protein